MTMKYDALLALMPTGVVGGAVASLLGVEPHAIVAGALWSVFVMVYALFIDPPRDPVLGPHQ